MRASFQVERVLNRAPPEVAGRVIEGTIAVGDRLMTEGSEPLSCIVEQIDVYGHSLQDVTAGTVAALRLHLEAGASPPEAIALLVGVDRGARAPRGSRGS